jgi:hypothetical protein
MTRSLDEGVIVVGSNTAEICRTSGDFVVDRLSIGD